MTSGTKMSIMFEKSWRGGGNHEAVDQNSTFKLRNKSFVIHVIHLFFMVANKSSYSCQKCEIILRNKYFSVNYSSWSITKDAMPDKKCEIKATKLSFP